VRRPSLLAGAGALPLLLLSAAPSRAEVVKAAPGTHSFTTSDAMIPVVDGPTNSHSATIDTRLYVPDNATAKTPQPAILMTHGFGLDKLSGEIVSSATFLARHGYVVLTYTAEGFGKSTGCVTLQSRTYDVKDAQQLITKVLQTKAYVKKDAKGAVVGMTGGSYGGGIQANVAESDPRIRAINPGRTWNSLQYSLNPNNYVVPGDPTGFTHTLNKQGVFKAEWTSLFFASGTGNPLGGVPPTGQPAGTCPQDKLLSGEPAAIPGVACTGFYLAVCQTYATISTTGDATDADRALLADSSLPTAVSKLKVPVLLFQGQSDTLFNVNDATSTYLALKRQGTPVQMVWNSGGHGGYDSLPGECDVYGRGTGGAGYQGLDSCYLSLRTLRFFDHWLRGKADPSPGFSWFRDWATYSGSGPTTQYADAATFPLSAMTFALSGAKDLTTGRPVTGSATLVNPAGGVPAAYTETSNFTGPAGSPGLGGAAPTEIPGQHADFTTPPFTQDVDSVGIPSLHVSLSHVAPTDLVLFGKVYDVAPGGAATLIHRLIAPVRIPSAALSKPVDLKLLGFAHRFRAGHSARLTLATTDLTSYNNKVADVITVTTGPGSRFVLPVAAAARVVAKPVGKPVASPATVSPGLPSTGLSWVIPVLAVVLLGGALVVRRQR
jgi:predicted acyl esterase